MRRVRAKRSRTGVELTFGDGLLTATVEAVQPDGNRLIRFHYEGIFLEILDKLGTMPLPPYIKEKLDDPERYQTVYSKTPGSAAAPTAGLHFTTELLDALKAKGVKLAFVTLHVGLGTFRPVKEDEITDHIMHSEYYIMDEETAGIINDTPWPQAARSGRSAQQPPARWRPSRLTTVPCAHSPAGRIFSSTGL